MRFRVLLLLSLVVSPLAAQSRLGKVEKRPKLPAGADTNDANSYFAYAERMLEERPSEAALAFYWAARLDPSSAEALDGRRASAIMGRPTTLNLYMSGGRRARQDKELRQLDSLTLRALRLNPLFYRKYEYQMLASYFRRELRAQNPNMATGDINRYLADAIWNSGPSMRAWAAYAQGQFQTALTQYEMAARNAKYEGNYRLERARIYALQGMFVPAVAEFRLAATALAKQEKDKDEDVIFYNSRAMIEHSSAIAFFRLGQIDSAKVALGRAMTEDLSYFMAHVELGRIALAQNDTVTAISELSLAAELAVDEPYVHYLHGSMLLAAGQPPEAEAAFKKALALEPLHAPSHFELGLALVAKGDKAAARESFQNYLRLAPLRDGVRRQEAAQRVADLAP